MASDDLDPLPEGDRQDTLQQLSLKVLRNRLPESLFLFRDERIDDKGVDGTLEAKVEVKPVDASSDKDSKHVFTNCRAHAQLKSTDSADRNLDGSISQTIATSNLNYLLNGTCPIYFLWIESAGEMRYAWARDEWRRLDAENPEWKNQGTFTVRFGEILDAAAVQAIHERILSEARLGRQIHETLARSALVERIVIGIDPQTLTSDDPREVFGWLTSCGLTIASSGYGKQVIQWLDVLDTAQRRDARVQLVGAYAQASLGRYHAAAGHLAEAGAQRASLCEQDREVLRYLQDVCRYQTGQMSQDEYLQREAARAASRSGTPALEHRMEVLRQRWLTTYDREPRAGLFLEMRTLCQQIQSAEDAAPAQKILARLHLLFAEGDDLLSRRAQEFTDSLARQGLGFPVDIGGRAQHEAAEGWARWEQEAQALAREAEAERHPLLVAEVTTTKLTVFQRLLSAQREEAFLTGAPWEPPGVIHDVFVPAVEEVIAAFTRADCLEGATRARLLLADLHDLVGDREAANALAEATLCVATAMGYTRLESHAREYTDGPTNFERFRATITERRSQDEDVVWASATEERLLAIARRRLAALRLPEDRLPVLVREVQALQRIARERLAWCRHIGLRQELTMSQATAYLTDPPRFCVCEMYGYQSGIRYPDAETVISAFKGTRCAGCQDRSPKVQGEA